MAIVNNSEDESKDVMVAVSSNFSSSEADLRLQSVDGVIFHVFSRILAEASPVFRDMISLPLGQAREEGPVMLSENADIIDLVLRFLYPMPDPNVTTLDTLRQLIKVADKYLLEGMIHSLRRILVSPTFAEHEPLRVYAIACMYGYEAEAKSASRHCLKMDIIVQAELYDELSMITARDFLRLVKLHQTRAAAIVGILNGSGPSACSGPAETAGTGPLWWLEFKARAKEEIRLRPLSDVIFQPAFLAGCVAVSGCPSCATSYVSPATQARLAQLKEKIDGLVDIV